MPTPAPAPVPFSYRESKDLFDNIQAQGLFQNQNLSSFSDLVNKATNSNAFEASDSWLGNQVKDFAVWKENQIRDNFPNAVAKSGEVGQDLFSYFGLDPESGKQLGESLPTMAADFGPALAGPAVGGAIGGTIGALGGPVGAAGGAVVGGTIGKVASSLLSAATAYEQTDSLLHAGVALAGFPIAGGAQKLAQPLIGAALRKVGLQGGTKVASVLTEEMAQTPIGKSLLAQGFQIGEELTQQVAKSFGDRLGYYLGGQAAVNTAFEGASFAVDTFNKGLGQAFSEHATGENLLGLLASNLPFAALDLPHLVKPTPLTALSRAHVQTADQINAGSLITEKSVEASPLEETPPPLPESPPSLDPLIEAAVQAFKTTPPLAPEPTATDSTPLPLPPEAQSSQETLPQVEVVPSQEEVVQAQEKVDGLLASADRVEHPTQLEAVVEAVAERKKVVREGESVVGKVREKKSGVVEDMADVVDGLAEKVLAGKRKVGRTNAGELGVMVEKLVREGKSVEEAVDEVKRVVGSGTERNRERNELALEKMLADREARGGGFKSAEHRRFVQQLNDEAGPVIEAVKEEVGRGSESELFAAHKVMKVLLERPEEYLAPDEMAGPEFQGRVWRGVGKWMQGVRDGTLKGKNGKGLKSGEELAQKLDDMVSGELRKRKGSAKGADKTYLSTEKGGFKDKVEAQAYRDRLMAKLGDGAEYYFTAESNGDGTYSVKRRARVVKTKLSVGEREVLDGLELAEEFQQEGLKDVLADEGFSELEKDRAKKAFQDALVEAEQSGYRRLHLDVREVVTLADDPRLEVDWVEFDRLIGFEGGEWIGDIPRLVESGEKVVLDGERYPGLSQVFGKQKVGARDLVAFLELRAKVITGEVQAGDFAAWSKDRSGVLQDLADSIVVKPGFKELVESVAVEHGLHPEVGRRLGERAEVLEGLWGGREQTVYGQMQGDGLLGLASTKGNVKALFLAGDAAGRELGDPMKLMLVAGHEAAHNYEWSMRRGFGSKKELEAFGRYQEFSELGDAGDKEFAMQVFADAFVPRQLRGHESVREMISAERNVDPAEWRANMLSLWSMSKLDLGDARLAHGLQPAGVRGFFKGLTEFAGRMYRSVKAAMGLTRGTKELKKLKEYVKQIEGYRKAASEAEATLVEASKLQRAGRYEGREIIETIRQELDGMKTYVGKSVTITKPVDRLLDWYDQNLNTIDQYVESMPVFRRAVKVAHSKAANASAVTKKLNSILTGTQLSNGQPSYDEVGKAITKMREDPRARRVINAWAVAQQRGGGQVIEYADLATQQPKIWAELNKLPANTHKSIKDVHERVTLMIGEAHKEIFQEWDEGVVARFRNIFASKTKGNWAVAEAQAKSVVEAVMRNDIPTAFVEMAKVDGWQKPEMQAKTLKAVQDSLEAVTRNKIAFSKKKGYWSLSKAGKWYMHWTDANGKGDGLGFDSEKDARAFARTHLQNMSNIDLRLAGNSKEYRLDADMFTVLEESHRQFEEVVDSLFGGDPAMKATVETLKAQANPLADIRAHLNAKLPGLVGSGRNPKALSTDHMDMLETQFHFMAETGNAIAKAKFNRDMVYEKLNPELDAFPEKMRMFDNVLDNFLHPDTTTGRNINTMNSIMFVASNISSWFVELTQGLSTFLPEMTRHGVGVLEGHKLLAKAHKKTFEFTLKSIRDRVDNNKNWGDKEFELLMDEASKANLISMASSVDGAQMDEGLKAGTDAASLRTRGKVETAAKTAGNMVTHLGMFSLRQYRKVTEHNARVSLLMGHELSKIKGLKGQEARDFAMDFSRAVTYSGGKLNRPVLPFSGKGAWRTFGQVAMSLQTYTANNIAQWVRYARTAFDGTLEGSRMSPTERKNAKRALAQMTMTQFGMAGLLGMPFVQSALILLGKAIDENIEEDVREGIFDFGKLLKDDDEFAGALQEIVSSGASNYMLEKIGLPVDFASRQSVGGMLGFNSMDGFSGDKLLGPTASLFASAMAGTRALVAGEPELAAQEFAPTGLKKAINLARNDFEITDKSGKRIVEDSTFTDKLLYAVGFQNTKLAKSFRLDRIRKDNGALESKDTARDVKKLADLYKINPASMLSEFQATVEAHPEREANAIGRAVADRLVETTFPQDHRRDGTRATAESDSKLLAMFGIKATAPSEMDRLLFKTKVLGSMGLDSRLTPSEVKAAQALDQLMRSNPNLTRQGAKVILARQPHSSRRAAPSPQAQSPSQMAFNFN